MAVLLMLQRLGQVTAAEVAAELEVSERTARRDLEALGMAGIPVYSVAGRGGGWRLAAARWTCRASRRRRSARCSSWPARARPHLRSGRRCASSSGRSPNRCGTAPRRPRARWWSIPSDGATDAPMGPTIRRCWGRCSRP
ncbi:MAG: HTH domain-containing protein [Acidimicrobiales bacterium]|nr:HTH domain-containing protein [Acidimicrobiales bacterium]